MFILLVTMHAKPEKREAFIAAITEDATASVRDEPGCLRFDVMQDNNDPNQYPPRRRRLVTGMATKWKRCWYNVRERYGS